MDFSDSPRDARFREELRAWLAANVPERRERVPHDDASLEDEVRFLRGWQRQLYEAGWIGTLWPKEYGGRGGSPSEQAIFNQEIARVRAPQIINRVGINNVGPTIIQHGTEEQKRRFLPPILSGEEIWCQLFSEPGAGSDLAAIRARAEPAGDDFVVTGQKVWTSYAQWASFAILLARTDPGAAKHRGISYFLLDMKSPGIEIRPLRQPTGSNEFNEVFLDAVRIPRGHRIGEPGDGWQIAMTTLAHERGTGFSFKEQVLQKIAVEELIELARHTVHAGRPASDDPLVRQEIARGWIDVEIMNLLNARTLTRLERGLEPGPETSLVKLFWSGLTQRLNDLALALEGPYAALVAGSKHAVSEGRWQQSMLWSRASSIAGGTSEVQRNIIAQRVLGLPKG